jgi:hypothetical protein
VVLSGGAVGTGRPSVLDEKLRPAGIIAADDEPDAAEPVPPSSLTRFFLHGERAAHSGETSIRTVSLVTLVQVSVSVPTVRVWPWTQETS